jgi:hypothetical protein
MPSFIICLHIAKKMTRMLRRLKAQSAMEYLMTYGWAILIIAVVLGTLFQLGVFSSSSFSVRAPPGACQVLRTSAAVNLVGQCSGVLPQYVAQFNGQTSYVGLGSGPLLSPANAITISAWIQRASLSETVHKPIIGNTNAYFMTLVYNTNVIGFWPQIGSQRYIGVGTVSDTNWHHVVAGYSADQMLLFTSLDGVYSSTGANYGNINTGTGTLIGLGWGSQFNYHWNGLIANVQIYNASLAADQIQVLYLEGIGGAPVKPQNLVGWWPLNGNGNDYSGSNNNGVPSSVSFTQQYGK